MHDTLSIQLINIINYCTTELVPTLAPLQIVLGRRISWVSYFE